MLELNKIYNADCLEKMKEIDDKSINMILADLPYGSTSCHWDTIIPFAPLWEQYKRIIKDTGAIVLTASQPFTSALVMSNIKMFKYEWIWDKKKGGNPLLAKIQPIKVHENILIFGKGKVNYYPLMEKRDKEKWSGNVKNGGIKIANYIGSINKKYTHKYPKSILEASNADQSNRLHPTQKPVALFEYLIKTYSNEGDLVLDNCAGSGTTGVACKNLNRNYILIEKEPEYIKIINERLL
jgi:site-specific DNA-methyltransferase (adenine-specific)